MKLTRILLTALVIVALLSTLILSAYAQGYDNPNNPGRGHDWKATAGNNNDNDHVNHHNVENGWHNHDDDNFGDK